MYDDERIKIGREPITIVELFLDYCPLTYGEGDCSAAVGVTGDDRCYNTRATCQDVAAYVIPAGLPNAGGPRGLKTYRFSTPNAGLPADLGAIPSLRSVSFSPTKIDPGKSLGRRGECNITLQDHPHHDVTIDKYVNQRAYDPMETGTFWAKFKERNPYYNGRIMRIYTGYLTVPFSWDNFQTRTYIIDQINGPSSNGGVSIKGRDILKLADDDRALCPQPTVARLAGDIAAGGVAFDVLPAGAGANFAQLDFIRVGSEVMQVSSIAGDTITVNAGDRGQYNTTDTTHKLDDTVQLCKVFDNENIIDIFYDLLVNYANVPASYIPYSDWQEESSDWLTDFNFSSIITEPMGVTSLIDELIASSTAYIFWDEVDEEIKLVAVKPPSPGIKTLTDNNAIIENSISITEKVNERISEVYFNWVQFDPTKKLEEDSNYQRLTIRVDADAESPVQYNDYRIKKVYSRWMNDGNESAMTAVQQRILSMYRNIPQEIKFKVDAKDGDIKTGDEFYLRHRNIVDASGAARTTLYRAIEILESKHGTWFEITARETDREFGGRFFYIQPDGQGDYLTIPVASREDYGGWISDSDVMSNGDDGYMII